MCRDLHNVASCLQRFSNNDRMLHFLSLFKMAVISKNSLLDFTLNMYHCAQLDSSVNAQFG